MYCELKNKEIEIFQCNVIKGTDMIINDCSENHAVFNGVKVDTPCDKRNNKDCLLAHRKMESE